MEPDAYRVSTIVLCGGRWAAVFKETIMNFPDSDVPGTLALDMLRSAQDAMCVLQEDL
jgi:hypothetical protein